MSQTGIHNGGLPSLDPRMNEINRLRTAYTDAAARIAELEKELARERVYIKKLDGIIEEVGGVTASCINPYEDLKRALIGQKQRAEKAEAELARVREDAERYRWLRDKSEPGQCAFYLSVGEAFKDIRFQPQSVDNSIDAARTPAADTPGGA